MVDDIFAWWNGIVPVERENATIAEGILTATAAMRKSGTFETSSLCWSPAELEALAMFAISAKHDLASLRAPREELT